MNKQIIIRLKQSSMLDSIQNLTEICETSESEVILDLEEIEYINREIVTELFGIVDNNNQKTFVLTEIQWSVIVSMLANGHLPRNLFIDKIIVCHSHDKSLETPKVCLREILGNLLDEKSYSDAPSKETFEINRHSLKPFLCNTYLTTGHDIFHPERIDFWGAYYGFVLSNLSHLNSEILDTANKLICLLQLGKQDRHREYAISCLENVKSNIATILKRYRNASKKLYNSLKENKELNVFLVNEVLLAISRFKVLTIEMEDTAEITLQAFETISFEKQETRDSHFNSYHILLQGFDRFRQMLEHRMAEGDFLRIALSNKKIDFKERFQELTLTSLRMPEEVNLFNLHFNANFIQRPSDLEQGSVVYFYPNKRALNEYNNIL